MALNYVMPATGHNFALPTDFREVINVEYPVNQDPPHYLIRKNELDPAFYSIEYCYDVTHNYKGGIGWFMYISNLVLINEHVYIYYLANHSVGLADDSVATITVPDEYENIIIAYVVAKAYRERLGAFMIDPQLIAPSSANDKMVHHAEDMTLTWEKAVLKLAESRAPPG
jgi:hypothetical protein